MTKYFENLYETLGKGLISDYKPRCKQIYQFEHYDLIIEPKLSTKTRKRISQLSKIKR